MLATDCRSFKRGWIMTTPARDYERGYATMNYRNIDLKIDQFIQYVNDDKINLIPPFQRGHVWNLKTRKKLIENIVRGRPIPAIFLYREATGARYEYNILDGKQRLESLILFVGNLRRELTIQNVGKYFFGKNAIEHVDFKIKVEGKQVGLRELEDDLFRDFQEYVIPTIEIVLSEENPAALDEMIDLFVDINSYGEKVKRFQIVKAMSKDLLLRDAFGLIAETRTRGKDVFYKAKKNDITGVLKKLYVVSSLDDPNSRVDRMWELLVELVLFVRTKKHRTPIEILKSFIKSKDSTHNQITASEKNELRKVFKFLKLAYQNDGLNGSRLVTNQIHFYTMVTAVLANSLMDVYDEKALINKLVEFGKIVDGATPPSVLKDVIKEYRELSAKHTTHPGRRADRQDKFLRSIEEL